MTPRAYFDQVWARCELFTTLHGFLQKNATAALQPDELLRAEWAARVSALDLFIHELVAQQLLQIFSGTRATCPGFGKLQISSDALIRIQAASTPADRNMFFDLEVRTKLSRVTFQYPDDIADGVRMVSACKLWNEVATYQGAAKSDVASATEALKKRLSLIADRRNKIVHEGDLQPSLPRVPWPITRADVSDVAKFIEGLVLAIEAVVA